LPTEEIEAGAIVQEALARLQEKIQRTGAQVTVEGDLPKLLADRTWATQGIYNFIANALKFTQNGQAPEIEVGAFRPDEAHREEVGLVVRDRGPGVPPELAEHIFGLFQRAVGHEIEGSGAGLAIVRAVARRHGGDAWVTPREGGGSEFVVTFGTRARQEASRKTPQ
jgi:signal transduction histidine kinase